jgi:serine/threonine-protein kinase
MELLEGQDLGRVVSERGALPVEAAIDYILQACEALATAHSLGIVHRDIKPENLFLSRSVPGVDIIKVLDFGISKLGVPEPESPQRSRRPTVRSTSAVGSPTYMSPEQIRALDDVDARADVWALGCVLYELLCGAPAFDAPSLTQLAAKILERPPAPLRSINPNLPPDLEWVIGHCLGKDPAKRFQNVGDLAAALCPFAAPRSRIVAERCRYVLDPTSTFSDAEETTGPLSWNGVSMGLGASSSRVSLPPGPSAMQRVTVAARRVVHERKRYAPLTAVAALGMILGLWRAVSPGAKEPTLESQTFLTAPGRGTEPTVAEALDLAEPAEAVTGEIGTGAPVGMEAITIVPDATATAVVERQVRPPPRVAPRRPAPPARPKALAAGSSANEPDVGY